MDAGLRRKITASALVATLGAGVVIGVAISRGSSTQLNAKPTVAAGVSPNGNEAPWAVRIELSGGGLCTGSVIAPRWVLTAGHCVANVSGATVRVGGTPITAVEIDPAPAAVGDVALLGLERDAGVPALQLADTESFTDGFNNRGVTFFGWGDTHVQLDGNGNPKGHYDVDTPATSLRKTPDGAYTKAPYCQSGFGANAVCFLKTHTFAEDGVAVLPGDSGGPWVAWSNGWVQIAVEHGGLSADANSNTGPEGGASVGAPDVHVWIAGIAFAGPPAPPQLSVAPPETPPSVSVAPPTSSPPVAVGPPATSGVSPSTTVPVPPTTSTTAPAPTTTTAQPAPQYWNEQMWSSSGANTFANYHNASGMGPHIASQAWVQVTCKVYDPTIQSASPGGYWYRIHSGPWNDQYYAVANTFWNGDPPGGPYTHSFDAAVPDC